MKRIVWTAVLAFMMMTGYTQNLRVATYNIRFDNPRDTLDLWQNRFPYLAGMIQLYDFDIFGTQEGLKHQLEDLKQRLGDYNYTGVGRDDGNEKGEHTAIFYKASKFRLLQSGNFWLSAVTDKPNKGWDAALPRICTWGKFEEISGSRSFFLFNTHFDHIGEQARKESAKLIIEMIRQIAGENPAILTGDFNFDETHPNFSIFRQSGILSDAYDLAPIRFAPGGTFTAFDITARPSGRIDHIFVSGDFSVIRYGILTNTYNGRFPSDHFAVLAEMSLQ
jgi:endonuclease/exonuclease/phosphatase family metal-dependent hydrolase